MGWHDMWVLAENGPLPYYSTTWVALKDNSEGKSLRWAELHTSRHQLGVKGETALGTDIYIYSFLRSGR